MSRIAIHGSATLRGELVVRGAKNAALPALIAAAAGTDCVTLTNVPTTLNDIQVALDTLKHVGCELEVGEGTVTVVPRNEGSTILPVELAGRFRYSLLFLGLLVGKRGHAKVSLPGGCSLGDRRYDLHLEGLRCLGAEVEVTQDSIEASATSLRGADIHFRLPTTTGTENVMLAACFAHGRTRIFNANTRPEIVDMATCLNEMGAQISVRNRVVEVVGPAKLTGAKHKVMEGWDEAMLYILAAGMTGGEVCVRNSSLNYIRGDAAYLKLAGMDVFEWGGNLYASGKNKDLRGFDLFTAPYPGVNSDMQPLFAALAACCTGESTITDQRFTERFQYAEELKKLGVPIDSYGNCAVVSGPAKLIGAEVSALDLRCGAALVLAGLAAEGTTHIDNCYQIGRGYEYLVERLQALGANITNDGASRWPLTRKAA